MDNPVLIIIIGNTLEGISYGIYCVFLAAYLKIRHKRHDSGSNSILHYFLLLNFLLCTAYLVLSAVVAQSMVLLPRVSLAHDALYTFIDLISQIILIYRCWVMWRQPWIMVVPILLSFAFLVTSLATLIGTARFPAFYMSLGEKRFPPWYFSAVVSFFAISLAVNALVTGLIVWKIISVFNGVQAYNTKPASRRNTVPPIAAIMIESSLITFVAQILQTIMYKGVPWAFPTISGVVVMLYGLSTTVVLVRVEMGLTYKVKHDTPKPAQRFAVSSETHSESITMIP